MSKLRYKEGRKKEIKNCRRHIEHVKKFGISMIGIPEGLRRENGPLLEEIMTENFKH